MRFLFVRPVREYLRISLLRDVIEEAPGPVFDVNGWDLRKALGLLAKGNATRPCGARSMNWWCSSAAAARGGGADGAAG